jgi:hypothetical protein
MKGNESSFENLQNELLSSMHNLFSDSKNEALLKSLREYNSKISFALIVNWIPEQGEDIYFVLIDENQIAVVDVPRVIGGSHRTTIISVGEYMVNLHASARRKLMAALDLMKSNNI